MKYYTVEFCDSHRRAFPVTPPSIRPPKNMTMIDNIFNGPGRRPESPNAITLTGNPQPKTQAGIHKIACSKLGRSNRSCKTLTRRLPIRAQRGREKKDLNPANAPRSHSTKGIPIPMIDVHNHRRVGSIQNPILRNCMYPTPLPIPIPTMN